MRLPLGAPFQVTVAQIAYTVIDQLTPVALTSRPAHIHVSGSKGRLESTATKPSAPVSRSNASSEHPLSRRTVDRQVLEVGVLEVGGIRSRRCRRSLEPCDARGTCRARGTRVALRTLRDLAGLEVGHEERAVQDVAGADGIRCDLLGRHGVALELRRADARSRDLQDGRVLVPPSATSSARQATTRAGDGRRGILRISLPPESTTGRVLHGLADQAAGASASCGRRPRTS